MTTMTRWGYFEGTVRTEWLRHRGPDRLMRLTEDFAYVDRHGERWTARAGSVIDGASIPRPLWSIEGSPFDGDYRESAVVHDQMCKDGRDGFSPVDSATVHRLFHDSLRAAGLSAWKARRMYWAVRLFGPRFPAAPLLGE